jgi:hypothetical protein
MYNKRLNPNNIFWQVHFITIIEAIKVAGTFKVIGTFTINMFLKMNAAFWYNDLYRVFCITK